MTLFFLAKILYNIKGDDDINTAYSEIILGDRQYLKDIIHLLHDDLLILSKNHQLKLTNDENVIEIKK